MIQFLTPVMIWVRLNKSCLNDNPAKQIVSINKFISLFVKFYEI